MKKYLCLIVFTTGCAIFANAQNSAKDSLLRVIAKEVCTEINKKDFGGKTAEELQMELGLAIMPSISSRYDQIQKYYGTDVSKELLHQVGEEVGMKLAMECPSFMRMFSENSAFLKNSVDDAKTEQTLSGILQKIVPGDFTYLQIKDPSGKTEKIWWMESFEGADKLSDQMTNKPVVITYTTRQTYNAQSKQYASIKVATKLQLIQ